MKKLIIIVFIISVCIASFALYAGITHNAMGEFCQDLDLDLDICKFDFYYAAFIWASWFIPIFFFQLIVIVIVKYIITVLKK